MCRTSGCDGTKHVHRRIALETDLLGKNDRIDEIVAIDVIGAPGAGKTTLLEHSLRLLHDVPIAVIEGDQATDHDAQRIAATGRRVVQVNTGAGCHLEANMIAAVSPLAGELESDVEALVVRRERGATEVACYLVPISMAYELVGRPRTTWAGFSGGERAEAELTAFFADLERRGGTW